MDLLKYFNDTITSLSTQFDTQKLLADQTQKDLKKAQDSVWRLWEPVDTKTTTLGPGTLSQFGPLGVAAGIGLQVGLEGGPIKVFEDKQNIVKGLAIQYDDTLASINRTGQAIGALKLLAGDDSSTFEEFMKRIPASTMSDAEVTILQDVFNKKRDYVAQVVTQPNLSNVDQLTVHEINKASTPKPNVVQTTNQLSDGTVETLFGVKNDEEAKKANDEEIIKQIHDLDTTITAIRDQNKDLTVKNLSVLEIGWMILNQPALAALDLANYIEENWSRPVTGGQIAIVTSLYSTALGEKRNKFSDAIYKAQAEGTDAWHSASAVYEVDWTDNDVVDGISKFVAEMVLDPVNWIGFSVTTRALKGIPVIGKNLASMHNGFIGVTEEIADVVTFWKYFKKIPKTPTQIAAKTAGEAKSTLRAALVQATGERDITRITADQVRKVAEDARNFVIEKSNLANTSDVAKFGKWQMMSRSMTTEELTDLAKNLKMKTPIEVSHVLDIQGAYGSLKLEGKGTGYTLAETTDRVLNSLGVKATEDNRLIVSNFLTSRQKADMKAVTDVFKGENVNKILKQFAIHVDQMMLDNMSSEVAQFASRNSRMAKVLSKIDEITTTGIVANIDKNLTVPMARQALVFGNFGPWNNLEVAMRGALRGYNLLPGMVGKGNSSIEVFKMIAGDLSNSPADLMSSTTKLLMAAGETAEESALKTGADYLPIMERWFQKIPGVGKDIPWKKVPKYLRSQEAFNAANADIGTRGYSEYMIQSYTEHLRNLAPEEFKTASEWANSLSRAGITSFDKVELRELQDLATHYALVGEDALKTLTPDITTLRKSKVAMGVDKIMTDHSGLDVELHNFIKEQMVNGKGIEDINLMMKNAEGILKDSELFKTLYSANLYDQMAEAFAKTPISTPEDLDFMMQTLNHAVENNWENISSFRSMATQRANDLKNPLAKDALHNESYKRLDEYMQRVSGSIEKMIKEVEGKIGGISGVNAEKISSLKQLMNVYTERTALNSATRLKVRDFFNSTLKASGNKRSDAFWKKYFSGTNEIWGEHFKVDYALKRQSVVLQDGLSGVAAKGLPKFQGDLLVSHIAYIFNKSGDSLVSSMTKGATGHFMGRDEFISSVMAKAESIASKVGTDAEKAGFTKDAISKCYDTICTSMGQDPKIVSELTPKLMELEDIRRGLHNVKASSAIDPDDVGKFKDWISKAPKGYEPNGGLVSSDLRKSAMEAARIEYTKDFPDYTVQNAATAILKKIYPFFSYESQRWPWVMKQLLSKPAVLNTYGHYMDTTDGGYIPIPATDYEFNPFTGSVWAGGARRLFTRDYPEYYDRFPVLANMNDWLSKRGFYPGAWYTLANMVFGTAANKNLQIGEILPPWATTGIAALNVVAPDNPAVRTVTDFMLSDRFRSYQNGMWLADHGYDADRILAKMGTDEPLTPEEQKGWNAAARATGWFTIANTQGGSMFRYRPKKLQEAYDAAATLIKEKTGIDPQMQDWITQHAGVTGKTLSYYTQLDSLDNQQIQELSGLKDFTKLTTSLLPSAQQRVVYLMSLYKADCADIDTEAKTKGLNNLKSFEDQDSELRNWCNGLISNTDSLSPYDWGKNNSALKKAVYAKKEGLGASSRYIDVPITFEQKTDYYKKSGVSFFSAPVDELVNKYYAVEPKVDPETGDIDWDTFYSEQEKILDGIPQEDYSRAIEIITKNMTPIQRLHWAVNREYFNPYYSVKNEILQKYSIEDQNKIKAYNALSSMDKATLSEARQKEVASIKETVDAQIKSDEEDIKRTSFEFDRDIDRKVAHLAGVTSTWQEKIASAKTLEKPVLREQRDAEIADLKAEIKSDRLNKSATISQMRDESALNASNKRTTLLSGSPDDIQAVYATQDKIDAISKSYTAKINAIKLPDKAAISSMSDEKLEGLRKAAEDKKDELRKQRDEELKPLRKQLTDLKGGVVKVYNAEVDDAQTALRVSDTNLDAWLLFWGKVSKPASDDTKESVLRNFNEIKSNIGSGNFQQYITDYTQKNISRPMPKAK